MSLSSTVAPAISSATVTLTLASAVVATDTGVKVSYTKPGAGTNNKLKDAANNEVTDFADRAVTNNTPAAAAGPCPGDTVRGDAFWSACLTIGKNSLTQWYGLHASIGDLTTSSFSLNGVNYEIDQLASNPVRNLWLISFAADPRPAAYLWNLQVGSRLIRLSESDRFVAGRDSYRWDGETLGWGDANIGDKVTVSLSKRRGYLGPKFNLEYQARTTTLTFLDDNKNRVTRTVFEVLVNEPNTSSYKVRLDRRPSRDVDIDVTSADPGAVTVSPSFLVFTPANWNTWQTVTVTGVDDSDGLDEGVSIHHRGVVAGMLDAQTQTMRVRVEDNDTDPTDMPSVVFDPGSLSVEDTETFTVKLGYRPESWRETRVTLEHLVACDGLKSPVTLTPQQLTFDSTNWNSPQTVTVKVKEDTAHRHYCDADELHIRPWWWQSNYPRPKNVLLSIKITEPDPMESTAPPLAPRLLPAIGGAARRR